MNSDLEKRPNISEIITKLNEWLNIIENENESRIKKQFLKLFTKLNELLNIFENENESSIKKQFLKIKKQFLESEKNSYQKYNGTEAVSDVEIPNDI
ncbi:hypothetical protein C2G38_2184430 [Gigaspora rosea]|uniref:Uncharacterized protein n=1 Tax=Gigaspora rosea TaxID=44941 RepID=A0A397V7U3_9GLOM|nr:hypothetical protein C2G38_2184430 [Gigaspora rosea]